MVTLVAIKCASAPSENGKIQVQANLRTKECFPDIPDLRDFDSFLFKINSKVKSKPNSRLVANSDDLVYPQL